MHLEQAFSLRKLLKDVFQPNERVVQERRQQMGSSNNNNNRKVAKGILRMATKGMTGAASPQTTQSRLGLEG